MSTLAGPGVILGRMLLTGSGRLRLWLAASLRELRRHKTPWQASFPTNGRKRSLVEPIGIDHAEGIGCGASQRGSKKEDGWRSATRSSRREAARPAREQPKVRSKQAEPAEKKAARMGGIFDVLVEPIGIEPTTS